MIATGPAPTYIYRGRLSFQGCIKAATTAGQRADAAMANRIFPDKAVPGSLGGTCFSCPRLKIRGKKKIARIMITSTSIS